MNGTRNGLLAFTVAGTTAGYAWLFATADARLQVSLGMLTGAFALAAVSLFFIYRRVLNRRYVGANLALGSIVHLAIAGVVAAGDHLADRGVGPGLTSNWAYFVVGLLGVGAAIFTWSRARPRPDAEAPPVKARDVAEPVPAAAPQLEQEPAWMELSDELAERADHVRHRQLHSLERIARALQQDKPDEVRVAEATRVLRQEVLRLTAESAADKDDDGDDLLSQAASFFEWGVQKLPELAKLDVPDLLLAQVVAEIRAVHDEVEHIFVPHTALVPIHPINRPTAEAKADERAAAARAALDLIQANGMKLSEDLIAAHEELHAFKSVTGFQVVDVGEGKYVTFEGNGRAAAIQRAFGEDPVVEVEVRRFRFDDPHELERVQRRVERVQRANGVLSEG
jgi:hypothetical protein